jgi:hypothetical protein
MPQHRFRLVLVSTAPNAAASGLLDGADAPEMLEQSFAAALFR